jgi:hypothetical protein
MELSLASASSLCAAGDGREPTPVIQEENAVAPEESHLRARKLRD